MSRAGVALLFIAVPFCRAPHTWAAETPWRIELDGDDVSTAAEARPGAGGVEVNLSRLAERMRLRVTMDGLRVTIVAPSGRQWGAKAGESWLESSGERINLPDGLRVEGMSAYLSADAVGKLAGLPVTVDQAARLVSFGAPPKQAMPAAGRGAGAAPATIATTQTASAAPEGWEPLVVEKSGAEQAETARLEGWAPGGTAARTKVRRDLRQPEQSDVLRLTTMPSVVVGADGAAEAAASGRLLGYDVDGNVLPTFGPNGLKFMSGRVSIGNDAAGWRVQGGDLFSETWGLARGLRYARKVGKRHQPSASLYLQARRDGTDRPMLSLMDQLDLGELIRLGGEVTSEGSVSGKAGLRLSRFSTDGYFREARVRNGGSYGAGVSYIVSRRLSATARYSTTGEGLERMIMRDAALRIALVRRIELTLQETRIDSGTNRTRLDAANLTVPIRQVRWNVRYQQRRTEYSYSREFNHEVTSTVGYRPNRRLSLDAQMVTRWSALVPPVTWDQIMLQWRITKTLEAQWTGSLFDPGKVERMRTRVQWAVRPNLALIAEYGNVSPYQQVVRTLPDRMLRIAIRKDWDVRSPAAGGEVRGQVVDVRGKGVSGVVVEAGPYSTETDDQGEYALRKLPAGRYQVKLRDDSVPSEMYASGGALTFESVGRRKADAPFRLLNLGEVRGWVYVDADGNGRRDPGEGISMISLVMGESATSSDSAGSFGFFNLKHGTYRVKVAAVNMPKDLELLSAAEVEVLVESARSETKVEFRLRKKQEKIIFVDPVTP